MYGTVCMYVCECVSVGCRDPHCHRYHIYEHGAVYGSRARIREFVRGELVSCELAKWRIFFFCRWKNLLHGWEWGMEHQYNVQQISVHTMLDVCCTLLNSIFLFFPSHSLSQSVSVVILFMICSFSHLSACRSTIANANAQTHTHTHAHIYIRTQSPADTLNYITVVRFVLSFLYTHIFIFISRCLSLSIGIVFPPAFRSLCLECAPHCMCADTQDGRFLGRCAFFFSFIARLCVLVCARDIPIRLWRVDDAYTYLFAIVIIYSMHSNNDM